MRHLGVLEAKTDFSAIVADVERTGEGVVVTRYGKAAVRIVPANPARPLTPAARKALVEDIIRTRDEIAARHPHAEPFDLTEALDRDRDKAWS